MSKKGVIHEDLSAFADLLDQYHAIEGKLQSSYVTWRTEVEEQEEEASTRIAKSNF